MRIWLLVYLFSLAACRTTSSTSSVLRGTDLPAITCAAGEPSYFHLSPTPFAVPASALVLQGNGTLQRQIVTEDMALLYYARLDVCLDLGGNAELKRVILGHGPNRIHLVGDVTQTSTVQGLSKLLFEGDYSDLKIRVNAGDDDSTWIGVDGQKLTPTSSFDEMFASAVRMRKVGNEFAPASLKVLVGLSVEGDPLGTQVCPSGESLQSSKFYLGTAMFETTQCTGFGGGETTSYAFQSIKVTDDNEALSPEQQGSQEFTTPEAIAAVLKYGWNHHNACDSFVLTLPHVTYAATSSPAAGCGQIVPGAPPRNLNDDQGKVYYTTKYGSAAPTSGKVECGHYLFFCNMRPLTANQFTWEYHNHGWNELDVNGGDFKLSITTPGSDGANRERNSGPGWRPFVRYNQYQYLHGMDQPIIVAKWRDSEGVTAEESDIYCKPLAELIPENQTTTKFAALRAKFGLQSVAESSTCRNFEIARSPQTQQDLVCMLSPNTDRGYGVDFIGIYLSMKRFDQPIQPWLFEWPKEEIKACFGGQLRTLTNANPK